MQQIMEVYFCIWSAFINPSLQENCGFLWFMLNTVSLFICFLIWDCSKSIFLRDNKNA